MTKLFVALFALTLTFGFSSFAEEDIDSPAAQKKDGKTINININDSTATTETAKKEDTKLDSSQDFLASNMFGPTGCKVAKLAKEENRENKTECNDWLKDQKKNFSGPEAGGKHVTGVCREICKECPMHMKDCSYEGTVHYKR